MSVLTIAEARAQIATGLGDPDLQVVIDREEAWLARRIGALTGARTETFWVAPIDVDDPLALRRPTSAVTVTDGGVALAGSAVRLLRDGTVVEKVTGDWTGPSVAVVSTPNDLLEVERVIVELLRLTVAASPYVSETIGDYSYSRGSAVPARATAAARAALVKDLIPHRGPGTIRLRHPYQTGRVGQVVSA